MRQVFLDTETTGLSPDAGDRVIEIGCVEFINRKATGKVWHHYLNPQGKLSSDEAIAVHGISNESLLDKPTFESLAESFTEFVTGAELIIHNAPFDLGFLNAELRRCDRPTAQSASKGVTDTLAMAKRTWPGKRNNLDALCDRLGVDNSGRTYHGALLDAQLLAEVYIGMTRGQNSLAMDDSDQAFGHSGKPAESLAHITLPVLAADAAEAAAHLAVIASLEKSGKTAIWRAMEPKPEPEAAATVA